eukprot:scaffold9488_cov97-Skeletonema_dohrnii-CCMP3373.AAC.2
MVGMSPLRCPLIELTKAKIQNPPPTAMLWRKAPPAVLQLQRTPDYNIEDECNSDRTVGIDLQASSLLALHVSCRSTQ